VKSAAAIEHAVKVFIKGIPFDLYKMATTVGKSKHDE